MKIYYNENINNLSTKIYYHTHQKIWELKKKMENKQLIIISCIILLAAIIIATGVYFGLTHANNNTMVNNTVNHTNNTTINATANVNHTNKTADKTNNNVDKNSNDNDYVYSAQKGGYVKSSGQYDSDGHGGSVYSYQGSDGVIYERYYDSNGKEISSEEHYR